jgi:carboxyl-terminal processing protease
VHDFDDGSSLRLTSAEWLTPDQRPIPDDGLKPNFTVEFSPGAATGEDPQLQKAIDLLLGAG